MDEVEKFFCQFPNPWALRVSGMGDYTSKCEKSQNHCTLFCRALMTYSLAFGDVVVVDHPLGIEEGENHRLRSCVLNFHLNRARSSLFLPLLGLLLCGGSVYRHSRLIHGDDAVQN